MATYSSIRGFHASALPRRSRRFLEDRTCAHPGCITRLSTYNRRETCFLHAGVKIPRLRGKKARV
ncbi:MAG: hypothetical protein ACREJP_11365 [Candidatus Methylomirabilales bacterium]